MSKITFRADDDLVDAVKDLDESKSEVMREALRAYLDDERVAAESSGSVDDAVARRVDELVAERLGGGERSARDVNVNISVEPAPGTRASVERTASEESSMDSPRDAGGGRRECEQCGDELADDHVYCPNCGAKNSRRVFCECGDEIRADWAFCPHCGRRKASADALDR
ncbi:MAG: zinc ribbon domain-containing protein [Halobacterium sp.]